MATKAKAGSRMQPWGRQCKVQLAIQGRTMRELSNELGIGYTYISAVINGRIIPTDATRDKISRALGIVVPTT